MIWFALHIDPFCIKFCLFLADNSRPSRQWDEPTVWAVPGEEPTVPGHCVCGRPQSG